MRVKEITGLSYEPSDITERDSSKFYVSPELANQIFIRLGKEIIRIRDVPTISNGRIEMISCIEFTGEPSKLKVVLH